MNEDKNAKQQCQPAAAFPCENQERNTKLSTFRSRQKYTNRSNFSPEIIKRKLQESDDECDLAIDVPPQPVNMKPGIYRNCTKWNRDRELAAVICQEEFCDSAITDIFECTEEKSEKIFTLWKNSKGLNKPEVPGNVFLKANEIYLPGVETDMLKVLEEGDALAYTDKKHKYSAASLEADMQKGILKQKNAKTSMLIEAFVQEHTTNEDCVSSGRVTQSVLCTGHTSKDESTTGRPYKEIINTEESQSIEVNCSNNSPEDMYQYPTSYLNKEKKSKITLLTSPVEEVEPDWEDAGLSEMDENTLEECRRIFEEFTEEAPKDSDKQAYRRNEHIKLLETKVNVPAKKRRIAHTAKFDVPEKKPMTSFNTYHLKQSHDAEIHQAHWKTVKSAAKATSSQASITKTSEQKKTKSRLSTTRFQSTRQTASSNLFEVQRTATSRGHLCVPLTGKVAAKGPCRNSDASVKRTIPVLSKVPNWRSSYLPQSRVKVPLETRQRYVKAFFSESFKTCSSMNEAFDKAMKEEQSVYDRCGSKKMYLNFAVKTLKKLRDCGQPNDSRSSSGAGSMKSEDAKAFTGDALYELLKNYLLTEEQLKENNFPRPNPEKSGHAILSGVLRNTVNDAFKRLCCRCGKVYVVNSSGEHRREEECNYHSGRVLEQKVPGGMEKRYTCCDRAVGSDGCQTAKFHVHDGKKKKLEGFMKTLVKSPPVDGNYGVYALDCEMCYTTHGLELVRVAVVNAELQVVYDTFVKPDGAIVDYDERLSAVTENDLKNTTTSLRGVQAILLNLFSADTILIGHCLENGLFVLKLIHDKVVDTSVVFPHQQGLPYKRQLTSLVADCLRKISQDDVCGHNSREDAIACMELMLWKVKEDYGRRK